MKKTNTLVLSKAMDILSKDIYCEDGIATAAILEASQQLKEFANVKELYTRALATEDYSQEEADAMDDLMMYLKKVN